MKRKKLSLFSVISIILFCLIFPPSANAATTITVTTVSDLVVVDGQCSLREAVISANTDTTSGDCPSGSGADTIAFSPSLPTPAILSLTLAGANEDNAASGDLDLRGILTIQGTDSDQIIIDGNGSDRVFEIRPGATIVISDITIRNGNPGSGLNGGGIIVTGGTPRAKLTLLNSAVINNSAVSGGGIQNLGNGATAIIENSRISSNTAGVTGGGISNTGVLTLLNSTLDQNQARTGGGIDHSGFTMNLTNVTISNNSANDNGGGVYNRADAIFLNVTLTGNQANGSGTGGNIFNDTASLAIKNSIVSDSNVDGNCFNSDGIINSQGHNLDSGNTCGFASTGDLINTDPMLGMLQDNGGVTFTHALLTGSMAIDHGDNAGCPNADQRGFSRPGDGDGNGTAVCDIGSYEFEGIPPVLTTTPTLTPEPTLTDTPTVTSVPTIPSPTPTPVPPIPPCTGAVVGLVAIALLIRFRY